MGRAGDNNLTLYRRTLGPDYDALPAVLRSFHDLPRGGCAKGLLRITCGQGWLRQSLAACMRLPLPGEAVPVCLEVQTSAEGECWIRDFASQRMVTKQWLQDGLLIETAGPLRFGFRMAADAAGMRFEFARCWLLRIPLPPALSPRVHAIVSEYENGWWVRVRIELPTLGLLTQYEGKMTPQC